MLPLRIRGYAYDESDTTPCASLLEGSVQVTALFRVTVEITIVLLFRTSFHVADNALHTLSALEAR